MAADPDIGERFYRDTDPAYRAWKQTNQGGIMNSASEQLARMVWELGALKTKDHPTAVVRGDERGFLLKAHESNPNLPLSPFYLNLRTPDNPKPGPLTQEFVDLAAKTMRTMVDQFGVEYRYVVGIPNAGDPFAASLEWDWGGVDVLHLGKHVGAMDRKILGLKEADRQSARGQKCLLVDDLVTQAGTKIEAVDALRMDGALVTDLVVLVDREQGGVAELANHSGVVTHSVLQISQLLKFYHQDMHCMSDAVYAELTQYLGLQ
jgi:orotate phosphoribosyltransferase